MSKKSKRKNSRYGSTEIRSVSITKFFAELMERYNISPTWALRKGIAIELFERGVAPYNSELNQQRSEGIRQLVEQWRELDELIEKKKELLKKLSEF